MQAGPVLTFDHYTVDVPNAQLWRGNRAIPLASQTFAVLRYLVEHAGQVVSKAELFAALWPGTAVSDGALTFCIVELRKALGDHAKQPKFIETVHRRGYRFLPAVTTTAASVQSSKFKVQSSQPPAPNTEPPAPLLVGRDADLAYLHRLLEKALSGERQIVFVTGEAGIGKTTLIDAFLHGLESRVQSLESEKHGRASRVQTLDPRHQTLDRRWWVAVGQCIEHYGPGEPYMPILEALTRVCREPGGKQLVTLLKKHAPTWLVQMPSLLTATEREALQRATQGTTGERMLREMGEAIDAITADRPLVLVLEDLHWSDASTLELLALLARRREPARLLVMSTYRPVDVIVQEHPVRAVKQELQLHGLCAELPLGLLSEAQVAEYLERRTEIERTPDRPRAEAQGSQEEARIPQLARILHRRTDGNPLFMVTVVDDLLSQGVLASVDGHWAVPAELATIETKVPENLQQLITQQIERLNTEERHLLEVASVAGMEFSAAAVAAGGETGTETVEDGCAGLARRGQFLRVSGTADWPDGTMATRYVFLHALYHEVLYNRIPAGRRQRLHQRIGEREEQAYSKQARQIAAALAVHFEQGRDYHKAVKYLQQAGENALRRSAHHEAIGLLTKGVELLKLLLDTPERTQQELTLSLGLLPSLIATKGYGSSEVERSCARARTLCEKLEETPGLFFVLGNLCSVYHNRGEFQKAYALAEQLLRLAQRTHDPILLVWAHAAMGVNLRYMGQLVTARDHLESACGLYDPQKHHAYGFVQDPGVMCLGYLSILLWVMGHPDQALQRSHEMLALAKQLTHPYSLAYALTGAAETYRLCGQLPAAHELEATAQALSHEHGFPFWLADGSIFRGWDLVQQGQGKEGIVHMRQGMAALRTQGVKLGWSYLCGMLATAYGQVEQPAEGLSVLAEAMESEDKMNKSALYRIKGELMLQQCKVQGSKFKVDKAPRSKACPEPSRRVQSPKSSKTKSQILNPKSQEDAEACFLKAIEVSRHQQAKSLELRATMSLSRLWQQQGKQREAHEMLSALYNWFTEGFDTVDLKEAKTLLKEIRH